MSAAECDLQWSIVTGYRSAPLRIPRIVRLQVTFRSICREILEPDVSIGLSIAGFSIAARKLEEMAAPGLESPPINISSTRPYTIHLSEEEFNNLGTNHVGPSKMGKTELG